MQCVTIHFSVLHRVAVLLRDSQACRLSVMQCVTLHLSVLHHAAVLSRDSEAHRLSLMQFVTLHFSVLHHVAVLLRDSQARRPSVMQCNAVQYICCCVLQYFQETRVPVDSVRCSVLLRCSELRVFTRLPRPQTQRDAVCYSVLQCVAACCSAFTKLTCPQTQCDAVC